MKATINKWILLEQSSTMIDRHDLLLDDFHFQLFNFPI